VEGRFQRFSPPLASVSAFGSLQFRIWTASHQGLIKPFALVCTAINLCAGKAPQNCWIGNGAIGAGFADCWSLIQSSGAHPPMMLRTKFLQSVQALGHALRRHDLRNGARPAKEQLSSIVIYVIVFGDF
jgi:hypothetical protein